MGESYYRGLGLTKRAGVQFLPLIYDSGCKQSVDKSHWRRPPILISNESGMSGVPDLSDTGKAVSRLGESPRIESGYLHRLHTRSSRTREKKMTIDSTYGHPGRQGGIVRERAAQRQGKIFSPQYQACDLEVPFEFFRRYRLVIAAIFRAVEHSCSALEGGGCALLAGCLFPDLDG